MKKLNKKKGFTLVELIVVIAIIGVLAAILIPTMMDYIVRSHVSNANSTAGKMRENVSYFMTQANAEGYGMFVSQTAVCDVDITIDNGVWTLTTSDTSVFIARGNVHWTGSGSGAAHDPTNGQNAETILAVYLANLFRDVTYGHVEFKLVGGVCFALYFTDETSNAIAVIPGFGDGQPWSVDYYAWDGKHQGVTSTGYVVGTSPVLDIR